MTILVVGKPFTIMSRNRQKERKLSLQTFGGREEKWDKHNNAPHLRG